MTALISVIIPAHRWDNYVAEAIQSVQQQTRLPAEIILVNDGAGAAISQPVRSQFPAVILVELEKNSGEAAARNAGVAAAKSEWIAFLDADDMWRADKLEIQWDMMQQHPEWRASYTGVTVFNRHGDIASFCEKPAVLGITDLLVCSHALPSSVLLRRDDYLALNGFDPGLPNATDHDFLLRFVLAGYQIGFVAEPLLRFRRAGHGNISGNGWRVLIGKSRFFWRNRRTFLTYGGLRSPLRFFGHVFGECASKVRYVWQRHIFWSIAKTLLWFAGIDWRKQLRQQEVLASNNNS